MISMVHIPSYTPHETEKDISHENEGDTPHKKLEATPQENQGDRHKAHEK